MTTPFTLDNIPYGVISTADNPTPRCATAFGQEAVDLSLLEKDGCFRSIPGFVGEGPGVFSQVCIRHDGWNMVTDIELSIQQPTLNTFAAMSKETHTKTRKWLVEFLSKDIPKKYKIPLSQVQYHFPMSTSNFSDFFCSLEHVNNVQTPFTPPNNMTGYTTDKAVRRNDETPHLPKLLLHPQRLQRPDLQSQSLRYTHPPSPRRDARMSNLPTVLHHK